MSNFDWLLAGASNTWFAYPYKYRGDKEDRKWTWTNHLVKIPFRLNRIFTPLWMPRNGCRTRVWWRFVASLMMTPYNSDLDFSRYWKKRELVSVIVDWKKVGKLIVFVWHIEINFKTNSNHVSSIMKSTAKGRVPRTAWYPGHPEDI